MLFDSFLALFRALFLEKGTKQYSVQNYYRTKGEDDKAQKIDDFLDRKIFSWSDKSIREILKFIADKFICHVDPISNEDLGLANFYMSHLGNPYVNNNLKCKIAHMQKIYYFFLFFVCLWTNCTVQQHWGFSQPLCEPSFALKRLPIY